MTKQEKIKAFDPNGVGLHNNNFIGLPFSEDDAEVVLLPVPWDVTSSSKAGSSTGPQNILQASTQLDLYDEDVPEAWKMGIYFRPVDQTWLKKNNLLRPKAEQYIQYLEQGKSLSDNPKMLGVLNEINTASKALNQWVKKESASLLDKGKIVGIVGGEHSAPLGLIEALAERHHEFGILHIDAHMDLRDAYQGFDFSHASIMFNALKYKQVKKISQVSTRDFCEEENQLAIEDPRIVVFTDSKIREALFRGHNYHELSHFFMENLPKKVYVSFDVDGLTQNLCPNTGTPVPGGLEFQQAVFILKHLVSSGWQIIGFDVSETAGLPHEWDGNVGARIAYKLANLAGKSNGKI